MGDEHQREADHADGDRGDVVMGERPPLPDQPREPRREEHRGEAAEEQGDAGVPDIRGQQAVMAPALADGEDQPPNRPDRPQIERHRQAEDQVMRRQAAARDRRQLDRGGEQQQREDEGDQESRGSGSVAKL